LVAAGYRVLAPDLPGHGHGARDVPFTLDGVADAAARLVKDSGARKVVVAGHSMGGSLALNLARRHPDQVRGLVLMATQASWPGIPPKLLVNVAGRLGTMVALPLLHWGARSIVSGEAGQDGWIHEELRHTSVAHLAQALNAMRGFDAEPWLAQLRIPVVVLVTTRDTVVDPGQQRRLAAAITGARVMEIAIDHADPPSRPGPFPEGLVAAVEHCARAAITL
jgi:3-oxoadipate enol-lactonase